MKPLVGLAIVGMISGCGDRLPSGEAFCGHMREVVVAENPLPSDISPDIRAAKERNLQEFYDTCVKQYPEKVGYHKSNGTLDHFVWNTNCAMRAKTGDEIHFCGN